MILRFHRSFWKMYRKLPRKQQNAADAALARFRDHPFDASLRNHALHGEYRLYRSIDVTGDLRAFYKEYDDDVALFVIIGTHAQLYE